MDFLKIWTNHKAGGGSRNNLSETDVQWNEIYERLKNEYDGENLITPGEFIYRVHQRISEEPVLEDYNDQGENYDQIFEIDHKKWRDQYDVTKIDFHDHWVSFTDSVDAIKLPYFARKQMRGLVIVMRAEKGIKIYEEIKNWENAGILPFENEVVAPLDKKNVVEILKYEDFLKKYDK